MNVAAAPARKLDKHAAKPLYAQLDAILREAIFTKKYAETGMMPSETELAATYGVSRMTARAVVTQLVNEGLVRRIQGKGTFVVQPKVSAQSPAYVGIREQLEAMGYHVTTELVEFKLVSADQVQAKALGVPLGEPLFFAKRIRKADGEPISIHLSFVPKALAPTLAPYELESEQLCVIMERSFALRATRITETLESVEANQKDAEQLGVTKGFPLLLLQDIHTAADGKVFEYTQVYFRGDKVKLNFEFTR
ncbi:MAG: GntR family transcriptional regulator [Propionibacteriaceae bacterium]|nr:GntR family transcriptional regulator [Propionibacteriaceae bacterium]